VAVLALMAAFAAAKPDRDKDEPKPLPAAVVKAWKDAGARVGWMNLEPLGYSQFWEPDKDDEAKAGAVAAFHLRPTEEGRLNLPGGDPGQSFGLEIRCCRQLTDAHLKALAPLQNLQILNLAYTEVTGAGLQELAGLKNLRSLNLCGSQLNDAGLKNVAALTSLEFLSLERTQVSDAGLQELAKLKKLRWLGLRSTNVTEAGIAELRKAMPNQEVKIRPPRTPRPK
jgi:hypothetical protein